MSSEYQLRRELADIAHRVYDRGLVAGTDGNISARAGGDTFLISPSGSCLGMLEPNEFVRIDMAGRAIGGQGRPSSERWMHIAAYAERPEGRLAHPSADHILPLFVALGAATENYTAKRLYDQVEMGALAMDAYLFA